MNHKFLVLLLPLAISSVYADDAQYPNEHSAHCEAYIKLVHKYGRLADPTVTAEWDIQENVRNRLRREGYPEIWVEKLVKMNALSEIFQTGIVYEAVYRGLAEEFRSAKRIKQALEHFSSIDIIAEQMQIVERILGHLVQLLPDEVSKANIGKVEGIAKAMKMTSAELKTFIQKLRQLRAEDPDLYSLRSVIYSILHQSEDDIVASVSARARLFRRLQLVVLRVFGISLPKTFGYPAAKKISSVDALVMGDEEVFNTVDLQTFLRKISNGARILFVRSNIEKFSPSQLATIAKAGYFSTWPEPLRSEIERRTSMAAEVTATSAEIKKLSDKAERMQLVIAALAGRSVSLPKAEEDSIDIQFDAISGFDLDSTKISGIRDLFVKVGPRMNSNQFRRFALRSIEIADEFSFSFDSDRIMLVKILLAASKKLALDPSDLSQLKTALNQMAKSFPSDSNVHKLHGLVNSPWGLDLKEFGSSSIDELKPKDAEISERIAALKEILQSQVQTTASAWRRPQIHFTEEPAAEPSRGGGDFDALLNSAGNRSPATPKTGNPQVGDGN